MIQALLKAIKIKIDADSGAAGLYTAVSGRRYISPQVDRTTGGGTSKYPFRTYAPISDAPFGEFTATPIERVRVNFSVFDNSDSNSPNRCTQIMGKLTTLFDDGVNLDLTAYGFTKAPAIRESGPHGPMRIEGAWQMTVDYMFVFSV